MLHSQRRRLADLERREATGERLWSVVFPVPARVQLLHFIRSAEDHGRIISTHARQSILVEEGLLNLVSGYSDPHYDFEQYLQTCPDDMMPTVVEAWAQASGRNYDEGWQVGLPTYRAADVAPAFAIWANKVLARHRIAFELIEGQMVENESRELHSQIVGPAVRLLARSDGAWASVESAYRDALTELSRGKPDNAITDAGTALQEALTACGATGNALGPLIASTRRMGLLAGHDEQLTAAVSKAADWVSADRSQKRDAHNASSALAEDAWLIVHVAGALILRLSKGTSRG